MIDYIRLGGTTDHGGKLSPPLKPCVTLDVGTPGPVINFVFKA